MASDEVFTSTKYSKKANSAIFQTTLVQLRNIAPYLLWITLYALHARPSLQYKYTCASKSSSRLGTGSTAWLGLARRRRSASLRACTGRSSSRVRTRSWAAASHVLLGDRRRDVGRRRLRLRRWRRGEIRRQASSSSHDCVRTDWRRTKSSGRPAQHITIIEKPPTPPPSPPTPPMLLLMLQAERTWRKPACVDVPVRTVNLRFRQLCFGDTFAVWSVLGHEDLT